jgi:glutaredoxin 3
MSAAGIIVYTTPFCGYCSAAKRLLANKGVSYIEINVMFSAEKRAEMEALSGRSTVPQIFIGDTHVGGYDDLAALDKSGDLDPLLAGIEDQ